MLSTSSRSTASELGTTSIPGVPLNCRTPVSLQDLGRFKRLPTAGPAPKCPPPHDPDGWLVDALVKLPPGSQLYDAWRAGPASLFSVLDKLWSAELARRSR